VGGAFLINFIRFVLLGFEFVVIARIVLSFIDPAGRSPFAGFINSTTEPILAPIRRILPKTGRLDFAPFIVILVIGMLLRAVA
jgi:YggT family protein